MLMQPPATLGAQQRARVSHRSNTLSYTMMLLLNAPLKRPPKPQPDLCSAALLQACAELGGAEVNSEAAQRLKAVAHAAHKHLRCWRPSAEQLEQLLRGRSHATAVAALATDRLAAAAAAEAAGAAATDDDVERGGVEALATLTLAVSLVVRAPCPLPARRRSVSPSASA